MSQNLTTFNVPCPSLRSKFALGSAARRPSDSCPTAVPLRRCYKRQKGVVYCILLFIRTYWSPTFRYCLGLPAFKSLYVTPWVQLVGFPFDGRCDWDIKIETRLCTWYKSWSLLGHQVSWMSKVRAKSIFFISETSRRILGRLSSNYCLQRNPHESSSQLFPRSFSL